MTFTVNFIERHSGPSPSIERVFRKVAASLGSFGINSFFEKLPYADGAANVIRNLREFRPRPADIYHVVGHANYIALVLPRERTVITVHDLTLMTLRTGIRRPALKKLYFDWPARRAARVTAISSNTANELATLTGLDLAKIVVVDNPLLVDPASHQPSFNAKKPRILQIGTAPNKNVHNLIRAVAGLDCVVHVVGPMTDEIDRFRDQYQVEIEHNAFLNDEGILEAYAKADIVALCSTNEGFGLPIIEAQALGVPVITSDRAPMDHVAGDAAVKIDPDDHRSIRRGIDSLINDRGLRETLKGRGRDNIRRFDPVRIAGEYENIYREIIGFI